MEYKVNAVTCSLGRCGKRGGRKILKSCFDRHVAWHFSQGTRSLPRKERRRLLLQARTEVIEAAFDDTDYFAAMRGEEERIHREGEYGEIVAPELFRIVRRMYFWQAVRERIRGAIRIFF
jgi:hypothetical protein